MIWSLPDSSTSFQIVIKDVANNSEQILHLGPSPTPNAKNVYEIQLSPMITTPLTRLLKFTIISIYSPKIYSVMLGYYPKMA